MSPPSTPTTPNLHRRQNSHIHPATATNPQKPHNPSPRPSTPLRRTLPILLLLPLVLSLPPPHTAPVRPADTLPAQHTDYLARLATATTKGRRAPVAHFLRWLHAPKTGTSFTNTLIRWGCTDLSPDIFISPSSERPQNLTLPPRTFSWDWLLLNRSGRSWQRSHCIPRLVTRAPETGRAHYALSMHRALSEWERACAVAFFRLPLQRTFSNYLHLSLHYNATREPREPLASFLNRTEFRSQQTKLLLGVHYRDRHVMSLEQAREAAEVVRLDLRFVGLTEHFELSVRLFHAKFGGVPHRAQFANVRPGITRYNSPHGRSARFRYDERLFEGWRDEPDEILYHAARKRFWKEVREMKDDIEVDGLGPVDLSPGIGY